MKILGLLHGSSEGRWWKRELSLKQSERKRWTPGQLEKTREILTAPLLNHQWVGLLTMQLMNVRKERLSE